MVSLFSRQLARFRRDRRGNVGLMFGLALLPLIGAVGCGIDYGRKSLVRSELNAAADAAALGAISWSSPAFAAAQSMTSDGPVPVGNTDAVNRFNAEASQVTNYTVDNVSADVELSKGYLTSKVTFNAELPTNFMGLFGVHTMYVAGGSTGATGVAVTPSVPAYADFYVLLDNSPSMGIGATQADITKLQNLTTKMTDGSCGFACHVTASPLPNLVPADTTPVYDPAGYPLYDKNGNQAYSNYDIARHNGVALRIDDVVTATKAMATSAQSAETIPNQFRLALYNYGATADTQGLTNIFPLSTDLGSARNAADNIALMTVNWWGDANDADTRHNVLLPAIGNVIPPPGDGSSPSKSQKFLFIVSDGVSDEPNASCNTNQGKKNQVYYPIDVQSDGSSRCSMPIDPALCAPIKASGVKIGVVYTTYLPIPTDNYYSMYVNPFNPGPYQPSSKSQIAINMQACASQGLYFETGSTLDISSAMQLLFQKALLIATTPRLQD